MEKTVLTLIPGRMIRCFVEVRPPHRAKSAKYVPGIIIKVHQWQPHGFLPGRTREEGKLLYSCWLINGTAQGVGNHIHRIVTGQWKFRAMHLSFRLESLCYFTVSLKQRSETNFRLPFIVVLYPRVGIKDPRAHMRKSITLPWSSA